MSIPRHVRQFIAENIYVSDPSELADDTLPVTGGSAVRAVKVA